MARTREELTAAGLWLRGASLLEQADYTLKLAQGDLTKLTPFGVTKQTLASAREMRVMIASALKDRALASADAQAATAAQNVGVNDGKTWLRQAIFIGQNAFDGDASQVDEFVKGPKIGNSVPRLSGKIERVLGLFKRDAKLVAKFGATPAFVKRGQEILNALSSADAEQETKLGKLPKGTEAFYVKKGTLYFLLKQVNRAGRAANVADPVEAAPYNLTILRRRGATRGTKALKTVATN